MENFHALRERQSADTPASPDRRVNLLNWDGNGRPAGMFPRQQTVADGAALKSEGTLKADGAASKPDGAAPKPDGSPKPDNAPAPKAKDRDA